MYGVANGLKTNKYVDSEPKTLNHFILKKKNIFKPHF